MGIDELTGGKPTYAPRPSVARGEVVVPPLSQDDPMTVILLNYTRDLDFIVPASNWMPRPDRLPTAGVRCVVLFDDDGDAWVPVWGDLP